jgi:L-asparaginase II
MATLYARLAEPERLGEPRAQHAARAVAAMRRQPYMVGGRHRVDTEVMSNIGGVVAKEGAEALDCAALVGPRLGIAVRVDDGGYRAVGPALIRVLELVGALPRRARTPLRPYARPPVLGGGQPVGQIVAGFDLETPR